MDTLIFAAPLQGLTEAPFRHFHAEVFGGIDTYFSPFMRVERGLPRRRDLHDITSPLNGNHKLVPQVICRDTAELAILRDAVVNAGYRRIDINMGCPFALQIRRGRGSALLDNPSELSRIADMIREDSLVEYSVKMRLGTAAPDGWKEAVRILNDIPLAYITVHARTATQQYDGEIYHDELSRLLDATPHKVVYNGDLHSAEDICNVLASHPGLYGVMVGRGLLGRPTLADEFHTGRIYDDRELRAEIMHMHELIFAHYSSVLCGSSQILAKIKPFWDYASPELFGTRQLKSIRKAGSIVNYLNAIKHSFA